MTDLVPLGMALYVSKAPEAPLEWTVAGKAVRLTLAQDPAAVGAQKRGILGYAQRVCGVDDPSFAARLDRVEAIVGVVIDPALDPSLVTPRVWEIARQASALVFHQGSFFDASGQVLASPMPRPAARDVDEPKPVGPPTAERVYDRARVLAAVAARGLLERSADRRPARDELDALRRWVRDAGIERELEAGERDLLFEPTVGGMGQQERIDAVWRIEGACVLSWALGRMPLPAHDELVDVATLMAAVGPASKSARTPPALRPADEIEAMRERLFSIHWRLVDFRVRPAALDFVAAARKSRFGLVTDGAMLIGTDLVVGGAPIATASTDMVSRASSIARERHQAGNWLVGDQDTAVYSQVGTDT